MLAVISSSIFYSTPLSEVLWEDFAAFDWDLRPFQAFSPENVEFGLRFSPHFNSGHHDSFRQSIRAKGVQLAIKSGVLSAVKVG